MELILVIINGCTHYVTKAILETKTILKSQPHLHCLIIENIYIFKLSLNSGFKE